MKKNEFIQILQEDGYPYKIEGNKIVITHDGDVSLDVEDLPYRVEFKNKGNVILDEIAAFPKNKAPKEHTTVFSNTGDVILRYITEISTDPWGDGFPTNVLFNNGGDVYLDTLENIHSGIIFSNKGDIIFGVLSISEDVQIKGVSSSSIIKAMSKRGIFT